MRITRSAASSPQTSCTTPNFGVGGHGRIYGYTSGDDSGRRLRGIKQRVERELDLEFQRGRLREERMVDHHQPGLRRRRHAAVLRHRQPVAAERRNELHQSAGTRRGSGRTQPHQGLAIALHVAPSGGGRAAGNPVGRSVHPNPFRRCFGSQQGISQPPVRGSTIPATI